jgi:hypothetical protein
MTDVADQLDTLKIEAVYRDESVEVCRRRRRLIRRN